METFNKKVVLSATAEQIPSMVKSIRKEFADDGYEVSATPKSGGGYEVSISKGGFFKTVLGLKTSLNVALKPVVNGVMFDAHVGLFKQEVIPAAVMLLVFWPVLLTQIWGLIKQSEMDDRALAAAQRGILNYTPAQNGFYEKVG